MKRLLTFLTLLTLFFGVSWAEEVTYSLTPDQASTGSSATSYITTLTEFTYNNVSWKMNQWNPSTLQIKTNQSTATSEFRFYNTSAFPGKITKVVIKFSALTVSSANGFMFIGGTSEVTSTSGGNSGTWNSSEKTITWTPASTSNYTFFAFYQKGKVATGSNYLADADAIVVTYDTEAIQPTLFDISYGSPNNGTISGPTSAAANTQVTLLATPDPGYQLGSWNVKDGSNNIIDVLNNIFTMPASRVIVNATFTALPTYGITVSGGTASPTSAYEGQTVTLTPTIPDGKEIDWDNTTVTPSSVTIDHSDYTFTMPGQAVTVAFAFKDAPTYTNIFERITSTTDLEVGKRYLLVYESGNAAAGTTEGSNKYLSSITTSITNNSITLENGSSIVPFTLSGSEGAYQLADPDGKYITPTAAKSLTLNANGTVTAGITFSGNNVLINFGSTYGTMYYNTSSPRFLNYTSTQAYIQLYKEVENAATVSDLYLIGKDMNSQSGWNLSTGPQFTYSNSAGTYAVDAYFDMADRCYFQFVDGLSDSNSNWNGLTGRYYASGNSDVAVDTYDMDGTVPLNFTNSTQYSPGQYAFTVPAGLYTIVVDKPNWKIYVTQHEVTMTISPNSATFETTKNVTLASNLTDLGGKIYYTTDGTTPSATNGTEYTGTITLDATTTIKAIAILNHIQSDVVEKTYTKAPAAPEITPASCTFTEPVTVSITAESGATIYYTTDGSTPTNESTQYNGSFTVSTTTTVKARAYVGEAYSSVAEATYTYSNVQPSTGDFELVTSTDQLVAGNEYIIMSYDSSTDYAMGSISSSKGNPVTDFTLNGTLGTSGSTVSAGTTVNVFTLGGTTGAWTLKQADDNYFAPEPSGTGINTNSSAFNLVITIGNDYVANIQNSATTDTRQIRYATAGYFRNYSTSQANTNEVYLYTRASNAVQNPVFSPVPGIYNVDIDVTISCPTDGATIYYTTDGTTPSATNGTEYTGEMVVSESTTFKAIAVKDGNTSSVVTAAYTINKNTEIATVTLTYSEPFTAGIGKFTIDNESGFSPVWSLDGNYGVKGTSYSNGTNYAATSRLISPIIDMTGSVQPGLTFSHQINRYFDNVTTQATVWIRETTDGTSGTWVQIPITFGDPVASGGWTNDIAVIDLTDVNGVSYADKKVQISFLYTNTSTTSGAGTWEIQNFVVDDNSEYRMVNNIAEFLALDNGITAKFKNSVTVLYDYAQKSYNTQTQSDTHQEYIWVKDESGYMQFYMHPTLKTTYDESTETYTYSQSAKYENGDIIPAGFVVTKNYYEYGSYVQAYTADALNAGFQTASLKGLADPEHMDFDFLHALDATNDEDVATWCNRYITLEKIKIVSKDGKNFGFANESGTTNNCVGYNKYNGDGSLLKDGITSADVTVPAVSNTYYNVKAILQLWKGSGSATKWEILPVEFTEWSAEEVTLRKLCADGIETHEYTISNNLLGVYAKGNSLWVKDDTGQSICMTSPKDGDENFEVYAEAADGIAANTRLNQAYYDQSNWCELQITSNNASSFVGKIIKGGSIEGTFSNKPNPTMTGVELSSDDIYSPGSYAPNYYMPANFEGPQECANSSHSTDFEHNFFFMNPKPQEYAQIVWAVWSSQDEKFIMSTSLSDNVHKFEGEFGISFDLNTGASSYSQLIDGYGYNFKAILRKTASKADGYMVYPLDLDEGIDPATSINTVNAGNGVVKSVKFYNVAGIESNVPFQGVNIVVTEYTDGTRTTTKMLKR